MDTHTKLANEISRWTLAHGYSEKPDASAFRLMTMKKNEICRDGSTGQNVRLLKGIAGTSPSLQKRTI
jgi:hypothetical protein